jgi:Cu+-exporting ATPase
MSENHTIHLSVAGMSCAGCVAAVEKALQSVPGVESASVNFAEHTTMVSGDVTADRLIEAVVSAGYKAAEMIGPEDSAGREAAEFAHYRSLLWRAVVAALVGAP